MSNPPAVDAGGWLAGAQRIDSPNFDARSSGASIDLLVIHSITLPPGEFGGDAIIKLFTNTLDLETHPSFADLKNLRVSSHFLIRRRGEVIQFVAAHERAWHAGVSVFEGRERCNDFSIGIELEGTDEVPFTEAQYHALLVTTRALQQRYPLFAIAAHSEIAPGRKTDPGPRFDWSRVTAALPALRRIGEQRAA